MDEHIIRRPKGKAEGGILFYLSYRKNCATLARNFPGQDCDRVTRPHILALPRLKERGSDFELGSPRRGFVRAPEGRLLGRDDRLGVRVGVQQRYHMVSYGI